MNVKGKCIASLFGTPDSLKSMEPFKGRAGIMRKIKRDIVFLNKYQVEDGICKLIEKETEKIMRGLG